MRFQRGSQIDVRYDLSIDDDERLAFEKLARVVERSAGPEYHRFFDVVKLDAECTAVAKCSSHRLRTMMQVDDDLVDTVRRDIRRRNRRAVYPELELPAWCDLR